jgi:hypothetical protein
MKPPSKGSTMPCSRLAALLTLSALLAACAHAQPAPPAAPPAPVAAPAPAAPEIVIPDALPREAVGMEVPVSPAAEAIKQEAAGQTAVREAIAWSGRPIVGQFNCELGAKISVSAINENALNLAWQNKAYMLGKVETSTGAVRFEDKASGLVWIQIPAKSMLLDSKAGRQLANECKLVK